MSRGREPRNGSGGKPVTGKGLRRTKETISKDEISGRGQGTGKRARRREISSRSTGETSSRRINNRLSGGSSSEGRGTGSSRGRGSRSDNRRGEGLTIRDTGMKTLNESAAKASRLKTMSLTQ